MNEENPGDVTCPVCGKQGPKLLKRSLREYRFLACPGCSFQFIHSFAEDSRDFDDYSWTKEYTENYDRYVETVIESLRIKADLAGKIMGRKPTSLLDVGCGNGLYLHAADVLGLRNLGTDIDRVSVEFAKGKGLNAVATTLEELELGETFDFVHLKAVLHLVPDPVRLLARAKRFLAPGGAMYVDVPNQGSLFSKLKMLRERTTYGQLELPLRRGAYNYRAISVLLDRVGLRLARRIFVYPGDKVFYPILGKKAYQKFIFRAFAALRISSFLGLYLVDGGRSRQHG